MPVPIISRDMKASESNVLASHCDTREFGTATGMESNVIASHCSTQGSTDGSFEDPCGPVECRLQTDRLKFRAAGQSKRSRVSPVRRIGACVYP